MLLFVHLWQSRAPGTVQAQPLMAAHISSYCWNSLRVRHGDCGLIGARLTNPTFRGVSGDSGFANLSVVFGSNSVPFDFSGAVDLFHFCMCFAMCLVLCIEFVAETISSGLLQAGRHFHSNPSRYAQPMLLSRRYPRRTGPSTTAMSTSIPSSLQ